ncbi:MAG: GNAT family N-acetyltransferase [Candidatus Brocadia sp.]|nr:GNAT family N-acetyltransferase [Candidatus Brocadia sp.]
MVDTPVTIRPYRQGDEKAINNLFNHVFHKSRTPEEWNWKFRDNPAGKDPEGWIVVAERNGMIIGQYASLATELMYGNRMVTSAQPVDTMIDPSAKAGINLIGKLCDLHAKYLNGIALFGFGFPNEAAYMVGKRFLGYKDLGEMVQLFKRLSLRNALKRNIAWCPDWIINLFHHLSKTFYRFEIFMRRLDKGTVVKAVDAFDERIDTFWNSIKERYKIMTARNMSYLNWRYRDKRYRIFIKEDGDEVTGYAVARIENYKDVRIGYIMDIFCRNDKIAPLAASCLKFFIKQGVDYVLCGLLRQDPLSIHLKRIGFREHQDIRPIRVVVTPLTGEIDMEYLLNQKNWHLTYGDTDGF